MQSAYNGHMTALPVMATDGTPDGSRMVKLYMLVEGSLSVADKERILADPVLRKMMDENVLVIVPCKNEAAYMDKDVFVRIMKDLKTSVLDPMLAQLGPDDLMVVVADNLKSHVDNELMLQWLDEKIVWAFLCPNATSDTQPMDVHGFRFVKAKLAELMAVWSRTNAAATPTKIDVLMAFVRAMLELTPERNAESLRRCGYVLGTREKPSLTFDPCTIMTTKNGRLIEAMKDILADLPANQAAKRRRILSQASAVEAASAALAAKVEAVPADERIGYEYLLTTFPGLEALPAAQFRQLVTIYSPNVTKTTLKNMPFREIANRTNFQVAIHVTGIKARAVYERILAERSAESAKAKEEEQLAIAELRASPAANEPPQPDLVAAESAPKGLLGKVHLLNAVRQQNADMADAKAREVQVARDKKALLDDLATLSPLLGPPDLVLGQVAAARDACRKLDDKRRLAGSYLLLYNESQCPEGKATKDVGFPGPKTMCNKKTGERQEAEENRVNALVVKAWPNGVQPRQIVEAMPVYQKVKKIVEDTNAAIAAATAAAAAAAAAAALRAHPQGAMGLEPIVAPEAPEDEADDDLAQDDQEAVVAPPAQPPALQRSRKRRITDPA